MTKFIKTGILSTRLVGVFLALVLDISAPFLVAVPPLGRSPKQRIRHTAYLNSIASLYGGNYLCSTIFQAMGNPLKAFILTISRQCLLYSPLFFLLNHLFGLSGMVYSQPITDLLMLFVSSAFIFKVLHPLKTNMQEAYHSKNMV